MPEIRPGVRRLFRLPARRGADPAGEVDEEIRLHLELRAEQLERRGLAPEAARAEAARRFGPLDEARRRLHGSAGRREDRMRVREWLGGAGRDLRVAWRGLRRAPGFVATAVACIALGVGVNAAAFSLFDELVRRPLPVPAPERLVNLAAPGPRAGGTQCNRIGSCEAVFSYPTFRDLERAPAARSALAGLAAHRLFLASVAAGAAPAADGDGVLVSGAYFPALGVRPALGRLLGPADDLAPGGPYAAVLSHAYWATRLGADPGVVGRQVAVNDRPVTVVGVAPPGFEGTTLGVRPAVFLPLTAAADVDASFGPRAAFDDRLQQGIFLFGRLRPGVTRASAEAALNAAYRPVLAGVEAPLQRGLGPEGMARFLARRVELADGRRGQSEFRDAARAPATFLFAVTGLVVLVACANVANLLLARGAERRAEVAVRLALGASRRRVAAQLLAEAGLLAAVGGAASVLVARGTLAAAASFVPPPSLGSGVAVAVAMRPAALAFAAAAAVGTTLLFGLFPALHASRPDLIAAVRAGAGAVAGGARAAARFRGGLVTAQVALAMALLASAGLFARSLRNVARVDLGLRVDQVVTFALAPALNGYDPARTRALLGRAEQELAALPGVTAVGGASTPLLTGVTNGNDVRVEGFAHAPGVDAGARVNRVTPGYLRALGVPLLAGREFTAADRIGAPRVAVVNEAFARKFGLGRAAVGKRMAVEGESPAGALDVEIVGLMRDARFGDVKGAVPPLFVTPAWQDAAPGGLAFYVRTAGDPGRTLREVPAAVARVDPRLPALMLKTMPQQVRDNVFLDRMVGALAAGFALLATLLAVVGLYGVLAYTLAQRTREIGVRMALGADAGRVRAMVFRQVGRLVLAGGVAGVAAALGIGRAVRSLLYGLEGHDPAAVGAAALVLAAAALAAARVPARRGGGVAPGGVLGGV